MSPRGRTRLRPSEVRQLKVFAWFLAVIDTLLVGMGWFFARVLDDPAGVFLVVVGVGVVVNVAFLLIVGGDLLALLIRRRDD
jgi:hypothetical protein